MRDYLTERNMRRALAVSGLVTVMALPRMVLAGLNLAVYLPASMLSMTLAVGAATAWGQYGGLRGLFPARRRMMAGCMAGVALGLTSWIPAWRLDTLREAWLQAADLGDLLALSQPGDPAAVLALLLWTVGFETVFFQASVISYLARLLKDWRFALLGSVVLRSWVFYLQVGVGTIEEPAAWLLAGIAAGSLVAGLLYVAAGWPAAAVYGGVLVCRHFF